jgi:hypothetical protein
MNLMTLIRLVALLAIAWVVLAMAAGFAGVGANRARSSTFFLLSSTPHDAVAVPHPEDRSREEFRLVDPTTGRVEPIDVPANEKWGLLSVSPWHAEEGKLEAAGRWVNRVDDSGNPTIYGLGLFRIPDGTVLDRVNLDVLPTGRPCWVPGRPREFLFPAGDGQLHHCRLGRDRDRDAPGAASLGRVRNFRNSSSLRPVTWMCKRPGVAGTFLTDPSWSRDPRLRRFLLVSMREQEVKGGIRAYAPSKIWWLEMNEDADAIVAAGQLTGPRPEPVCEDPTLERFPSVSTGPGGQLRLVYLAKARLASSWQLCRSVLTLDPKTGKPTLAATAAGAEVLGEGLAPSPVVPSADGQSVYAPAAAGQLFKYPKPPAR